MPIAITVSGPPRSLAQLTSSGVFKDLGLKYVHIEGIYGPYYAPHLYSQEDVEEIVGSLRISGEKAHANQIPIFSSTGVTVDGGNF